MDKVEKLARIIAKSVTGLDPDTRVSPLAQREVGYVSAWIVQPEASIEALWLWFAPVAQAVLDAGFDCADAPPVEQPVEQPLADEASPQSAPTSEAVAWDKLARPAAEVESEAWRERMGLV